MLDDLILSHKLLMRCCYLLFTFLFFLDSFYCCVKLLSNLITSSIFLFQMLYFASLKVPLTYFFLTSSNSFLFYNLVFLSLLNTWDIFTMAVLETLPVSFIITALWVCFFFYHLRIILHSLHVS